MRSSSIILIAAMTAALVGLATPAHPAAPVTCVATLTSVICVPSQTNPSAKTITIDGVDGYQDPDATPSERLIWAARCKPRRSERDPVTGMRHWIFAERGCEFGP